MTDPIYCPYCGTENLVDGIYKVDRKPRFRTIEIEIKCCTQCGRGFYPIPEGEYQ